MDKNEKKRTRESVGEHLDVAGARLTDDEAVFCVTSSTTTTVHTGDAQKAARGVVMA